MTEKELHKLSREDLLRLLLAQSKEVSRQKAALEAVTAERGEARETVERLKEKLNEKDEQIGRLKEKLNEKDALLEKLKGRLDEKDALLAGLQEDGAIGGALPVIRTAGVSEDMRAALGVIEKKLDALGERLDSRDEENRHLWTLLNGMMDQMEGTSDGEGSE